jgi:hypothetical protein
LHPRLHTNIPTNILEGSVALYGDAAGGTLKSIVVDGRESAPKVSAFLGEQHLQTRFSEQRRCANTAHTRAYYHRIELIAHLKPSSTTTPEKWRFPDQVLY